MKIKVKRSLLTALCLTLAAALLITGCTGNGETAGGEAGSENKGETALEEGSIRCVRLDDKSAESVEYFIDEYGLYEYKAPDEAMQMKLVRFSYENGELADHVDMRYGRFFQKWKISEKGRLRFVWQEGQVQQ